MTGWERHQALDGVRALALALVLLSHGGVGWVGGAIGVDLFLVLSGYLITAILRAELDATGRIDLRSFWARRARRLVPAAVVLVAVVAVTARPDPADSAAALGWWANWHFGLADAGYFDAFSSPSPLRHTWSLGVEEQWYLLWPPLLLLLHRRTGCPHVVVGVVAGLVVASVAVMALVASDVDRAHMGTDTRAQALLVGALLALVPVLGTGIGAQAPVRVPRTALALVGLTVLLVVALRVPGDDPWLYRGGHLVVALAGTALVAAAAARSGPVPAVLGARPIAAVGRLSYGAYLWHWPLFGWLTPDRTGLDPWPLLVVRTTATAAAAALSWHLVERRFLAGRPLPRFRLVAPAAVVAGLAVVVGAVAHTAPTSPAPVPLAVGELAAARIGPAALMASTPAPAADVAPAATILDSPRTPRPAGAASPVATVVGDSTGQALAWAIRPETGVVVHNGAILGCGLDPADLIVGETVRHEDGDPVPCPDALAYWRQAVAATDPDVVVLAVGAWEVYDRQLPDGDRLSVGTPRWEAWLADGLEAAARSFAAAAPHARIAVTEVPCFDERDLGLGGPSSARNDPRRRAAVDAVIHRVVDAHPHRLVVLPWRSWICDGSALSLHDGVHLGREAAQSLWAGPLGAWVRTTTSSA